MHLDVLAVAVGPLAHGSVPLAYLDPGSGSLLIQAALAAMLSVPFLLRTKIHGLWLRMRGRKQADVAEADTADKA
jgi:hypothetical protein